MKGACSVAFNDMRSQEDMRKVAEEYDLKLSEDYRDEVCKLEAEVRDLKAKLSRLEQPDAENYLDEEMDAMNAEAQQENKKELLKKLETADVVCFDCGSKYGEYHDRVSSVWEGKCNVCGEVKNITESRDFKYLAKGIKELTK
jgi:predicted nuclease with TOPRIM domain